MIQFIVGRKFGNNCQLPTRTTTIDGNLTTVSMAYVTCDLFLVSFALFWMNSAYSRIFNRCVSRELDDAELVADARTIIEQRAKALAQQKITRLEGWNEEMSYQLDEERSKLREANGTIHRLETTVREMMRLRDSA